MRSPPSSPDQWDMKVWRGTRGPGDEALPRPLPNQPSARRWGLFLVSSPVSHPQTPPLLLHPYVSIPFHILPQFIWVPQRTPEFKLSKIKNENIIPVNNEIIYVVQLDYDPIKQIKRCKNVCFNYSCRNKNCIFFINLCILIHKSTIHQLSSNRSS